MEKKGIVRLQNVDIRELMELLVQAYYFSSEVDLIIDPDENTVMIETKDDEVRNDNRQPNLNPMFVIEDVPVTDELMMQLMHKKQVKDKQK